MNEGLVTKTECLSNKRHQNFRVCVLCFLVCVPPPPLSLSLSSLPLPFQDVRRASARLGLCLFLEVVVHVGNVAPSRIGEWTDYLLEQFRRRLALSELFLRRCSTPDKCNWLEKMLLSCEKTMLREQFSKLVLCAMSVLLSSQQLTLRPPSSDTSAVSVYLIF